MQVRKLEPQKIQIIPNFLWKDSLNSTQDTYISITLVHIYESEHRATTTSILQLQGELPSVTTNYREPEGSSQYLSRYKSYSDISGVGLLLPVTTGRG